MVLIYLKASRWTVTDPKRPYYGVPGKIVTPAEERFFAQTGRLLAWRLPGL